MIRILDTLHDENGDTVDPGRRQRARGRARTWTRRCTGTGPAILPGVEFLGTGTLSDRIWMKPSVTVIGMDLPNTAEASNVLIPEVDGEALDADHPRLGRGGRSSTLSMAHLRAQRPWNCEVEVERIKAGQPFAVDESHPAIAAAIRR